MRKARGARWRRDAGTKARQAAISGATYCTALAMVLAAFALALGLALLAPRQCFAEGSRDGYVNPGNAEHLGEEEDREEIEPAPDPLLPEGEAIAGQEGSGVGSLETKGDSAVTKAGGADPEPVQKAVPGHDKHDHELEGAGEPGDEGTDKAWADDVSDAFEAEDHEAGGAWATEECGHCHGDGCDDCGGDGCVDVPGKACGILEFHGPLNVINTHPPTAIFLGPVPEAAAVLPEGRTDFRLHLDLTNVILRELDSGIITDYDFEQLRLTADWRQRAGSGELSVRVPLNYRSHGFMDNIISQWHGWLGLPNGLRNRFPDNMYRFTIVTREGVVFNDEGDSSGIGDISVGYKLPLWNHEDGRDAASVRAVAKLPTGSPDHAFGSGNFDFQIGALYQHQFGSRWRGYANVDYVFVGEPDWDNVGWQDMPTYLAGVEYAWDHGFTVGANYRIQRNGLRVGSKEADKDAQELALGFSKRFSDTLVWTGGFNEDLNPETAPDFVVNTELKWEF
ncbi:DUF3187 family protein [bacterium]|nr:DUF3187 family protein [bacterium]